MEYVLLAVDVIRLEELVLVAEEVVLLEEDDLEVAELDDDEVMVLSMPTQYEYPPQKFVTQSEETAGLYLRKSACVIWNSVSMKSHSQRQKGNKNCFGVNSEENRQSKETTEERRLSRKLPDPG
ncbi:MAG: hypothetical protein Q9213_000577 [Squamulea squamosa]